MDILMKIANGYKLSEQDLKQGIQDLHDNDLILKVARGEKITDKDLATELYEVCDSVHASCDSGCPVYRLNGNKVPYTEGGRSGCDCFKNGTAMLKFIRKNFVENVNE